jgi:HPt (histidine-containing phosphotransfer) domain-containing protein
MSVTTQLDEAQLATLRMLRNGQLLGGLIRTYRAQLQQQLPEIQAAIASNDIAHVANIAHSMKSASFTLGATQMGQLSTALESAAMQRDIDQCITIVSSMNASYNALLPELVREEQA